MFVDFSEYVITRRHMKTGKYIYISYFDKLYLSLMHFLSCAKYSMMNAMKNCLEYLMTSIKNTATPMKHSREDICNTGKSSFSLGAC